MTTEQKMGRFRLTSASEAEADAIRAYLEAEGYASSLSDAIRFALKQTCQKLGLEPKPTPKPVPKKRGRKPAKPA